MIGLVGFCKKHFKDKYIVGAEIGVYKGAHAVGLIKELNFKKLFLVDAYLPYHEYPKASVADFANVYEIAKRRVSKYKDQIEFIIEKSLDVSSIPDSTLDFVYIDADHRYEEVIKDLVFWVKKVKPNGILCGHDYGSKLYLGVTKAVDEFAEVTNHLLKNAGGEWWIVRRYNV